MNCNHCTQPLTKNEATKWHRELGHHREANGAPTFPPLCWDCEEYINEHKSYWSGAEHDHAPI